MTAGTGSLGRWAGAVVRGGSNQVEHGAICSELVGLNRTASATRREQGPVGHQGGEIRVFGFVKAGENVFGGSGRGLGRASGLSGGHCGIQIAIDSCVCLLSGRKSGIGCERP